MWKDVFGMEGRGSDISSAWNGLTHGIMICTTQGGTAAIFDYVTPVVNVDDDDKADDEGGFDGDDTQDEGKKRRCADSHPGRATEHQS